jgi:CheY-like chemotaxis protein
MPFPEILVVDDEPANLQVVRRFLLDTRYVVTTAGSAREALETIDAHGVFDVYVLDVMMPEMGGTELADTIRARQPGALVLYFTGFSDALFSGTRKLRDGEAFIQKPVTKRDVLEAISLLLYKDLRGPRE